MSQRSSIEKLAPEVRRMIQERLYARGFSNYVELTEELRQEGVEVSKSALHRFGKKLERTLKELESRDLLNRSLATPSKAPVQEVNHGC
jgi:transposase-like protein